MRRPGPNLFQRGARSALASNLVEPPRGMPAFRPQAVATPQGLPGLIPYGPHPQGPTQSSTFTGGTVPSPFNLTGGDQTPGFTAPDYGGGPPVSPVGPSHTLSPLLQALSSPSFLPRPPGTPIAGPAATGAIGGGGFGGGATSVPGIGAPRAVGPGGGGGFQIQPNLPTPTTSAPQPGAPSPGLNALIAALAQTGQKLGGRTFRI
jgi:hypothetical protein